MMHYVTHTERRQLKDMLSSLGIEKSVSFNYALLSGHPDWVMIDIPDGIALGKQDFARLSGIATFFRDEILIVATLFIPDEKQKFTACSPEYIEFKAAIASDADFSTYDVAVAGRSRKWIAVMRGLDVGYLYVSPEYNAKKLKG